MYDIERQANQEPSNDLKQSVLEVEEHELLTSKVLARNGFLPIISEPCILEQKCIQKTHPTTYRMPIRTRSAHVRNRIFLTPSCYLTSYYK